LLDWAKDADAWVIEDDYDSEFRYDGAPLLSLAGIDHLRRVIYMGTFAKTLFPGLRIGYCALPAALIGPATTARAALDRFPGTLLEGAVADMLNSGAFAANLRKVRGLYREARDVLAQTLSTASEGRLSVPVPSQGLHLVARFDSSADPAVASQAKATAGVEGWLLAETYIRARPIPGSFWDLPATGFPNLSHRPKSWRRHRSPPCARATSSTATEPVGAASSKHRGRDRRNRDRRADHRRALRIACASLE
jgi:GntR family transcriptional regulator/MocR family aminotransferase